MVTVVHRLAQYKLATAAAEGTSALHPSAHKFAEMDYYFYSNAMTATPPTVTVVLLHAQYKQVIHVAEVIPLHHQHVFKSVEMVFSLHYLAMMVI